MSWDTSDNICQDL